MQKQPEKLYIVTESKAAGGEKSTTCSYIYNGFMRNELKNEEGSQIMIYNPEEEITYMYNPEEEITYMFNEDLKTGMKFSDGEDVEMDQVDLFDTEYEDFEGLISAELTTLNGDEVIYMIAEVDEDGIQVQTCTWISTKYKYPIKTEIYYNGNFAFGSEVLEILSVYSADILEPADSTFAVTLLPRNTTLFTLSE